MTDSIDAALKAAAAQEAAPFRINLKEELIETLKTGSVLAAPLEPGVTSSGAYGGVNIYPTLGISEVLAQPAQHYLAVHIPIST